MEKRFKKGEKATTSMPMTIKGVNKDTNTLTMVASTQDVDRHGDTVLQAGWDLKPFEKNPVILNSHRYNDATNVIARAENVRIEGKGKRAKLIMDWIFAVDENPKAKIIFDLYAGKFLHASSVGFIPRKFAEKPDGSRDWFVIEEAELLEVSAVSVPANAMALAKSKGLDVDALDDEDISDEDNEELDEEVEVEVDDEDPGEVEEDDSDEVEPEEADEDEEEPEEEDEEVEIDPDEQEPEVPAEEKKVKPSKNALVLKAIHNIESPRIRSLKEARDTINELLNEHGLKTLSDDTKDKVHKRKVNKVIRKLMKCK
jgi:HK97 family phage prohead protease